MEVPENIVEFGMKEDPLGIKLVPGNNSDLQ